MKCAHKGCEGRADYIIAEELDDGIPGNTQAVCERHVFQEGTAVERISALYAEALEHLDAAYRAFAWLSEHKPALEGDLQRHDLEERCSSLKFAFKDLADIAL